MMNQRPPLQGMANQMAQYGRYGDSMLVHMNPAEVQGIAALSPTGSLTTNPVTGQPEAFLPFLAPLLGSAFGSSLLGAAGAALGKGALGTALTGIAGNAALSSAIGSGLATTAATGDLKKGILSGITGYGLGQVMDAAQAGLNTDLSGAQEGLKGATEGIADTSTNLAQAQADLATMPTPEISAALPPQQDVASMLAPSTVDLSQSGFSAINQAPDALSASAMDPAKLAKMREIEGLQTQLTARQAQEDFFKNKIGDITRETSGFDRLKGLVQAPGAAGAQLMNPATLATIGTGEGKRGEIEMQERFARDARFADREKEEALRRAKGNIMDAYRMLEQDYPGYKIPGAQAGGITSVNPSNYMSNLSGLQMLAGGGPTVQNFNQGGRSGRFASSDDYSQYMGTAPVFGPGTAAQRQANIRGSQVISPEQLQGYRPGFGPEIMYFQRPATAPTPTPGPGPMPPGPGPTPTPTPGPTPTPPDLPIRGGGIGDFDYGEFLESDEGRQAMEAVRGALGIPDFSTIDSRLAAIETRPDPTIPTIDYDEITERVRGGIDIPDFDLSGIESRLGAIEGREIPTIDYDAITDRVREGIYIPEFAPPQFDYDEIANRVRGSIDIPEFDLSGIETRLGAIEGREMPTVDLSGIESRLGAIEGREMPTFDTSGIMSAIDANRQAIAGMPTVDLSGIETRLGAIEGRPDPTFDTSGIMSAIDANRQAIAGLPAPTPAVDLSGIESRLGAIEGRPDPTFDTSGIMSAIAANREAIAGLPAPAPAFDPSGILAAIEENRKAIGGINSGGINPNPTAGLPTVPVKQAPIRTSPIRLPKGFAEGGETDMSAGQGSRIIDLAIAAVMGQLPEDQAEAVINRFVDEFGPEAFAILRRQVLQSNVPGAQTEGEIKGNGGGMDDKVPGMIGNQQPVAVSPGEFIVPADVVSGIGDGSTDAGVEELYGMMDRVRQDRTGTKQQPQPVNKAKVMPV